MHCTASRRRSSIASLRASRRASRSTEAAAYPTDFNHYLAQAAAELVNQHRLNLPSPASVHAEEEKSGADAAVLPVSKPTEVKGSTFPPRTKAPAPAETLVHPKAPAPAETLGDKLKLINQTIQSAVNAANDATSIRKLSFADENIAHEEPEVEELSDDVAAPSVQPTRKHAPYEKTAGARATRSQKPVIARAMDTSANFRAPGRALLGLGIGAGFAMAALGMSVASCLRLHARHYHRTSSLIYFTDVFI